MSKEWGSGQSVVFSHGWPLNADAWENQIMYPGRPACLSQILMVSLCFGKHWVRPIVSIV